jgi:RNA polymerase sigma factor (TIGR02999 family)
MNYNVAMSDITRILSQIESGDSSAAEQLLPLVYEELRKLAAAKLTQEKPGQTLQPTALVHEAYLRLVNTDQARDWNNRAYFFGAAAEAMRRILIDNARRKKRFKHGGDRARMELDGVPIVDQPPREDLLALDAALDKLKQVDGTAAELVQLRYFAGLTVTEAADILDISPRTTERVWSYARAWLHREIKGFDAGE